MSFSEKHRKELLSGKEVLSILEEAVKFSQDINNNKLAKNIQDIHDHLSNHVSEHYDKVLFSGKLNDTISSLKKGIRNNLVKHTKALAQQVVQRSDTDTTDIEELTAINKANLDNARSIESLTSRFQALRPQVKKVAEQLSPPPQSPYKKQ